MGFCVHDSTSFRGFGSIEVRQTVNLNASDKPSEVETLLDRRASVESGLDAVSWGLGGMGCRD